MSEAALDPERCANCQAPLSGVDEKPMKRATAAQLRDLLAAEEISEFEKSSR